MGRYSPEFLTGMKREPMTLRFINRAIDDRAILEALVIGCDKDNTLKLRLGKGIIGEIPFSELEYSIDGKETKIVSAVSKVGKHIRFIPKSVRKDDTTFIVECSRRDAQLECYNNYISKLSPGDVIPAKLVRVENYGVFCDIGCGIIALLPTNNISVTHIINPKEALACVKQLSVVVKEIDENHRIQLSHKELLGTWREEASKFKDGEVVCGTVLSIEDYGVFVRLSQNLSGLAEPTNINLKYGDTVSVMINNIIDTNMKIKLSIIEKIEDAEPERLKFTYTQHDGHIKEWVYSTEQAKKQIKTVF